MKPAICTQCGGLIEVDETRDAGICQFCKTPFVTEKVINNYVTNHHTVHNITENVTKIIYGNEKDEGEDYFRRGLTHLKLKDYMAAKEEFERACSKSPERAKYWFYDALSRSWGFKDDNYYEIEKFFALATEQDKLQLGSEYGINLHNYTTFCVYIASKRAKMSGDEARRFGSAPRCGNPKDCEVDAVTVKAYTDAFAALSDAEKLIFARLTINNLYSILKPHLSEDFEKEFARSAEKALNTRAGGYFFINYPEAFTDGEGVMRIDADKLFPAQAKRNICIGTVRGVRRLDIHGTCLVSCSEKIPAVSFDIGTEEMWKMCRSIAGELLIQPQSFKGFASLCSLITQYDSHFFSVILYHPTGFKNAIRYSTEYGADAHNKENARHFCHGTVCGNCVTYPQIDDLDVLKAFNENLRRHFAKEIADGTLVGYVEDDMLQPRDCKPKQGCYVASCVYGSYDCPEVWVLRRYRDQRLDTTAPGRLFIRAYYAVSPTLVRLFGKTRWFRALFRKMLDKMVKRLRDQGFAETPYHDKY